MIKKVEEKELAVGKTAFRQCDFVEKDLEEAEREGIELFELVGEYYNYKTLAQSINTVMQKKARQIWHDLTKDFIHEHCTKIQARCGSYKEAEKDPDYIKRMDFEKLCGLPDGWRSLCWSTYMAKTKMYEVRTRQLEDRKHVYVKVDWNAPKRYYEEGLRKYKEYRASRDKLNDQ